MEFMDPYASSIMVTQLSFGIIKAIIFAFGELEKETSKKENGEWKIIEAKPTTQTHQPPSPQESHKKHNCTSNYNKNNNQKVYKKQKAKHAKLKSPKKKPK